MVVHEKGPLFDGPEDVAELLGGLSAMLARQRSMVIDAINLNVIDSETLESFRAWCIANIPQLADMFRAIDDATLRGIYDAMQRSRRQQHNDLGQP